MSLLRLFTRWMPLLFLLPVGCTSPHASPATDAAPASIPFDTYGGYFVSNRFEPDHAASFLLLTDQQAFDAVFGVARVMGDTSHRLPAHVFDDHIVLAAIKRGHVFWQFQVAQVLAANDRLTLRYTATAAPADAASYACPLIVSVPKGHYRQVVFEENGTIVYEHRF